MKQPKKNKPRRRDVATLVADIHGVTADHVRKVIRGDRENDHILATYMHIIENDNLLLQATKKLVPFNPPNQPS
jgi:hypothetical protein